MNNADKDTRDKFVNEDSGVKGMHADWINEDLPETAMQMLDGHCGLDAALSVVRGAGKKAQAARRDIRTNYLKATTITDYMADNVARLLMSVKYPTEHRYRFQPDEAPWMSAVFATGAGMKLKQLMSADAQANYNEKYALDFWFKRQQAGTGAAAAVSRPAYAMKSKKKPMRTSTQKKYSAAGGSSATAPAAGRARAKGSGRGGGGAAAAAATTSARSPSVKAKGECANPKCESLHKLVWCKGCGLVAYCGAKCQKSQWKVHKGYCKTFTTWDKFVTHAYEVVMYAQVALFPFFAFFNFFYFHCIRITRFRRWMQNLEDSAGDLTPFKRWHYCPFERTRTHLSTLQLMLLTCADFLCHAIEGPNRSWLGLSLA